MPSGKVGRSSFGGAPAAWRLVPFAGVVAFAGVVGVVGVVGLAPTPPVAGAAWATGLLGCWDY